MTVAPETSVGSVGPARLHRRIAYAVVAASLAYTDTSLWSAILYFRQLHLIEKLIAAPGSVAAESVARLDREQTLATGVSVLIYAATSLTLVIWLVRLRKRLEQRGHRAVVSKITAWRVWRVGFLASLVLTVFLRPASHPSTSLAAFASSERRAIAYLIVRAFVGLAYAWLAWNVGRTATRMFLGEIQAEPDVYDLANAPD
jgi:hypothetical protein